MPARIALPAALALLSACAPPPAANVDWDVYLGDAGRRHYSPLAQMNRANVGQLELAWVYDSGTPEGTMYASPLVIDGVLYGLSPQLVPFALDAATGAELWRQELGLGRAAQRGLMWWPGDDASQGPRLFFTAGKELVALDPASGQLIESFGEGGKLDLTPPVDRTGYLMVTAPGVVFEDKLILGFSTTEWADAFPGSVRAFSALDGRLVWQFDAIPAPGAPGSETWAPGALAKAGGANVLDCDGARCGARACCSRPPAPQRRISSAPAAWATTCSPTACWRSMREPASGAGTTRWCATTYGIATTRRRRPWCRYGVAAPPWMRWRWPRNPGHLYLFDRETGESLYPIVEEGDAA